MGKVKLTIEYPDELEKFIKELNYNSVINFFRDLIIEGGIDSGYWITGDFLKIKGDVDD